MGFLIGGDKKKGQFDIITGIMQLLDEVDCDIMNYECKGLSYLPELKVKVDNTDKRSDNSRYPVKTTFRNYFIIQILNNQQKKTLLPEFAKV